MNTIQLKLRNGVVSASGDSITIGSRLDVASSRQFARAVQRLAGNKPECAIVDLSRTRMLDSSGFGALISGLKRLRDNGITPIVVCVNSSIRRLMDFAGIGHSFAIVDSLGDARKICSQATTLTPGDALAS